MNISQSSTGKLIYDRKVANLIEKSQFEGVEGIVALFFFYKYISLVFPVLFPEVCRSGVNVEYMCFVYSLVNWKFIDLQ